MDKSVVPVNQIATRSSSCYEFSNPNGAEVVELEDEDTSVGIVEREMEELKLNYQFNENDVPPVFKFLINYRVKRIRNIWLRCEDSCCLLELDDSHLCFEKNDDDLTVRYEKFKTTIETSDPEKSIIAHLWFVLKNPNIKLEGFGMETICNYSEEQSHQSLKMDSKKLDTFLQSMLNTFDHQIQVTFAVFRGFHEKMFLSMFKKIKPGTLEGFVFDISWKETGNYQKMNEIVETDQWRQARRIYSFGVTPLKIDDLFQYETFGLILDSVTPNDVLRASEHFFNSTNKTFCILISRNKNVDIDAILKSLRSQNDRAKITVAEKVGFLSGSYYNYVKSGKRVGLSSNGNCIAIQNH